MNDTSIGCRHEDYAGDARLFYPGANLSEAEKARLDDYSLSITDVTVDHLIHSMSRQIENNFQTFYTVAEDVVGEGQALEIAEEIGRRYGGGGYAKWLIAHGYEDGRGTPRTMALYQDLVHAIRGPKHTSALFAEYDGERCVVKRRNCIYYSEENPGNGKYTEAFERGCFAGYKAADSNIVDIKVIECRYQGASGCEQHWIFDPDRAAETAPQDGDQ
jgi:hypothetical protein